MKIILLLADGSLLADNHAAARGGALHAAESTIDVEGGVRFEGNGARLGGGLSVRSSSLQRASGSSMKSTPNAWLQGLRAGPPLDS